MQTLNDIPSSRIVRSSILLGVLCVPLSMLIPALISGQHSVYIGTHSRWIAHLFPSVTAGFVQWLSDCAFTVLSASPDHIFLFFYFSSLLVISGFALTRLQYGAETDQPVATNHRFLNQRPLHNTSH